MADNGFKINKSANLNPQAAAPANPVDGDFYYDATAQSFAYYHNGSWANFDSVGNVSGISSMTSAQFTPAIVRNSVIKVTGHSTPIHLLGMSSSFSAKRITVYNGGTDIITVEYDDVGEATSNNRIYTPTGGDMNLVVGEVAVFTYDVVAHRWLLVSISSQGGAQVIATTTSPGLVTLHQASLSPPDGYVLSDGDLNTATGVVGLDANRAAAILAPTSAVDTLTLTAHAGASALVLNGAAGVAPLIVKTAANTVNSQFFAAASGALHNTEWLTSTGTVLAYMTRLGALQFNSSNASGAVIFEAANQNINWTNQLVEIFSPANSELTIGLSTDNVDFVDFLSVPTTSLRMQLQVAGGSLWQALVGTTGTTVSGSSPIAYQNVKDPVSAQDAATKNYVDKLEGTDLLTNYILNGGFDFWQRTPGGFAGGILAQSGAGQIRKYIADRWYIWASRSATVSDVTNTSVSLTRFANTLTNNSTYMARLGVISAPNDTPWLTALVQEIDREYVLRLRGKKLRITYKLKANSGWGTQNINVFLTTGTVAGGTESDFAGYTGTTVFFGTVQACTTSTVTYSFTTDALPTNVTEMALHFQADNVNNPSLVAGQYVDVAEVQLTAALDVPPQPQDWVPAGGSAAADLQQCLRYYEKSYEIDTLPSTHTSNGQHQTWLVQTTATGNAYNAGFHPRFVVEKQTEPSGVAGIQEVLLYESGAGTLGSWSVGGVSTVSSVGVVSTKAFSVLNDSGVNATATTTSYLVGHWTASAEI